jgi:iron complex outermembrane recepter protein
MIFGFTKTRARLAGGAAILALSAGAAMAQENVEQVTVTSTRLQAAGFDAPTPTTVIGAADIAQQAKPSVFDTLTNLPAVQGSTGAAAQAGTTSNGLIGLSAIGLRGLSPLRTLVLIDNQRFVAANLNGTVDVSQMPQMLIQRVDIVTGGASAAWGSDAVAGVVNFVTDKKFEGFKMNAVAGLSGYGDMGNVTFQAAAGTSFAGGRGHFETAVEYSYNDGLLPRYPQSTQHTALPGNIGGRDLSRTSGTASYGSTPSQTPAGQPQSFYGPLRMQTQFAAYGLVQSGPKAGMTFGSNSVAYPEPLAGGCTRSATGALSGAIGGICFGTPTAPGDTIDTREFTQGLINPLTRGSVYMRASYDLTPDTEVYATLTYSGVRTENTPAQGNSDKSGFIHCDNAYLPGTNLFGVGLTAAQTQAACLAAYPTATGKNIFDNGQGVPFGSNWANILTDQNMHIFRQTRRFVVGGDGVFDMFGSKWNWNSYFEHGEGNTSVKIYNMPLSNTPVNPATGQPDNTLLSRFNLAQDAVVNAGGNIVCRNTIAQTFGCVPFNPFGVDPINPAAQAYFDNQQVPAGQNQHISSIQTNRQESFDFSINGSPFSDWAGPVAVAAGYAYREEHYSQRSDPYAAGVTASTPPTVNEPCTDPFIDCGLTTWGPLGAYNAGNYKNGRGTYHVNEVFVEFGVPLLNDNFWGKIDADIAGRHARYSTAGDANTWKVGLTWETPIPGIRFRATQSRDIRAPNLSELEPPPVGANGSFNNDFLASDRNHNIIGVTAGNLGLKPERSYTTEAGIVWQPEFLPGFQASIDYYRIGLAKAIFSYGTQNIEDQCFFQTTGTIPFGNWCAQTAIRTANGQPQTLAQPGLVTDPNNVIQIIAQPFNAATMVTDGFDLEASYSFDLEDYDVPGSFTFRSLINHISKFTFSSGIPGTQQNQELAGAVNAGNNGQTYTQFGGDVFNYKILETQSYANDVWGFDLTERWDSPGVTTQNRNYIVCNPGSCPAPTIQWPTINYNKVDSMFYFDLGLHWNMSPKTQIYTKIDNVTNIRPPDIGQQDNNQVLYDVIGRMFRVGVRLNY